MAHIYRLGRRYSLGRNKQYTYVYRRGKSYPGYRMVLVYLKARELKVGFSVSSKVGNAVTRNRLRRRMKEDFRMLPFGAIWNGLCEKAGVLPDGAWLFDCKDYEKRVTSRRG